MTIRDYKMSDEQQRQYNQMERQFLLEIEKGVVTVEIAIAKYAKLAQIQCGFIYDEDRVVHELVRPEDNPRLNLLLQLLAEEVAGKVCVVYRHRAMLPFLIKALVKWDPAWIKGGMKPEETSEQKARFNADSQCRIILLQCDAAKYGHTYFGGERSADKCRTMIFFENSYSRRHPRSDRGPHPSTRADWGICPLHRHERVRSRPPDRQGVATQGRSLPFGVQGTQAGGAGMSAMAVGAYALLARE